MTVPTLAVVAAAGLNDDDDGEKHARAIRMNKGDADVLKM